MTRGALDGRLAPASTARQHPYHQRPASSPHSCACTNACCPWLRSPVLRACRHLTSPAHPTRPPPSCLQVFDFDLWKRHRSSSRYWRHITGIFESRTVSPAAPRDTCPGLSFGARGVKPQSGGSISPACACAREPRSLADDTVEFEPPPRSPRLPAPRRCPAWPPLWPT